MEIEMDGNAPARMRFAAIGLALLLLVLAGCSHSDQEKTRQQADEAKTKVEQDTRQAREDARKLGREARRQAEDLRQNIDKAVQPTEGDAGQSAKEKLQNGGQELRRAGRDAARKIDKAALIAKVKGKLANQVGLDTMTGINVDANGHVVTLEGKVSSPAQKQQAEATVAQLPEVTKVVNNLTVEP